jgi:hypothetical protein
MMLYGIPGALGTDTPARRFPHTTNSAARDGFGDAGGYAVAAGGIGEPTLSIELVPRRIANGCRTEEIRSSPETGLASGGRRVLIKMPTCYGKASRAL